MEKPHVITATPPTFVSCSDIPSETTPSFSPVNWKTIFGGPHTSTSHLTQGICRIPPGKALKRHHHSHVETYYVLEGEALMETGTNPDGISVSTGPGRRLKAGDAVFLPGDCPHKTFNDSFDKDFVFLYTFAADKFSDVHYCYLE